MRIWMNSFFRHPYVPLLTVLCIAAFFTFLKLGSTPLYEWDESLHGELAIEMLRTGDYLNYYFAGEPEAWFAKPPLGIWSIALSFKLFGLNVWALRLPSALAMLGTFFFLFKLIRLYRDQAFAFFTVLMLISIHGLICRHVGRSGDLDGMLLFFLISASYFFLRFIDFEKRSAIIWVGLFLGFAFLTKGAAFAVLLPGWIIYGFYRKKLWSSFSYWQTWLGLALPLISVFAWVVSIQMWGTQFENTPYQGENAAETAILFDVFTRFTETNRENWVKELSFFFKVMDSRFTLWGYWIYILLLIALFQKKIKAVIGSNETGNLHLFSFFSWFPLSIFLTLVTSKFYWYLAPAFPFIAINGWELIKHYSKRYKLVLGITIALFIVTLGIKLEHWSQPKAYPELLSQNVAEYQKANRIVHTSKFPMNYLLFMHFQNPNVSLQKDFNQYEPNSGDLMIIDPEKMSDWHNLNIPHDIIGANEIKTIVKVK